MTSFVVRTLTEAELALSQLLRAQVYCRENGWVDPARLTIDGREEDIFDKVATHGGAFLDGELVGTFRLIPAGWPKLPVENYYRIPPSHNAVELSRLAVAEEHRASVAMLGLCRWIYGEAMEMGATHMYALMEFWLISSLIQMGFPFEVLRGPHQAYKNSQDFTVVCPVAAVVPGLLEADRQRKRKYAPLFINAFEGEISLASLRPEAQEEVA